MLNNKIILITGGTGSFGQFFVNKIINKYPKIKKIIIFSRDELKQYEMIKNFSKKKLNKIRFLLGDVRDQARLAYALESVDYVIHAAALKQVPAAEYNPFEFIKTNIIGADNLVKACIEKKVKKVIALSTDKAAAPINLYGATKLCSEKIFIAANNIIGKKNISFSIVRYGNVMASRGSVVPLLLEQDKSNKNFTITHPKMTRFNISLDDATNMVLWCLKNSKGGEIFVPKIPSYKILDLVKSINAKNKINIIGLRPGEKLYEEMITVDESYYSYDLNNFYAIITPSLETLGKYYKKYKKIPAGKSYNSQDNYSFLKISDLKKLIKKFR